MSEENVEVVRRIHQALGEQDLERLLSVTDPAVTCYDRPSHPDATVFHGHHGVLQMLATRSPRTTTGALGPVR